LAALKTPILDQLNKDDNAPVRAMMIPPKLDPAKLVKEGALAPDRNAQEISFDAKPARYLCLQALSAQNGDDFTTLAELEAFDSGHQPLSREGWKIVYVDSEENSAEGAPADNVLDGDPDSFWHTLWSAPHSGHPHTLVIDLGAVHQISGLRLLPRQDSANGRIKNYRLYLSLAPF
jgi:beta-galactosidase